MTTAPDPFAYLQPFTVWQNVFTPAELDTIIALGDRLKLENASVSYQQGQASTADPVRVTRTAWLERNPESEWIYDRMERAIRALNAQVYRFELTGFADKFQYTVYDGAAGSHFGWHVDQIRDTAHRKLSFSLQLSDPAEYQGCDLEFQGSHEAVAAPRSRGALVGFPAYGLHRVTPIRAGTRKALVVWTAGPPFR